MKTYFHYPSVPKILVLVFLSLLPSVARAVDWSQYNGPLGDNSSPEAIRTNWTAAPPKVLWRKPIGPGWSSISVSNGRLFTQARRQTVNGFREFCVALDAATGVPLKSARLEAGGGYSSSPVAADGKLYTASEDGTLTVLQAGREWRVLSSLDLGEPCFATPALSGGSVFVRTDSALYRFGGQ